MDAAEIGLKAAAPAAKAVAVLSADGTVKAIAGKADDADWAGAASAAGAAGQAFWLGRAAKGDGLYAVDSQESSAGRTTVIALGDLSRDVEPPATAGGPLAMVLATPDGRTVVAAEGANGAGTAGRVETGHGRRARRSSGQARPARAAFGRYAGRHRLQPRRRRRADGGDGDAAHQDRRRGRPRSGGQPDVRCSRPW